MRYVRSRDPRGGASPYRRGKTAGAVVSLQKSNFQICRSEPVMTSRASVSICRQISRTRSQTIFVLGDAVNTVRWRHVASYYVHYDLVHVVTRHAFGN